MEAGQGRACTAPWEVERFGAREESVSSVLLALEGVLAAADRRRLRMAPRDYRPRRHLILLKTPRRPVLPHHLPRTP